MGCDYYTWEVLEIVCETPDGKKTTLTLNGPRQRHWCWRETDPDIEEKVDELQEAIRLFGQKTMLAKNVWTCTASGRERVNQICAAQNYGDPIAARKFLDGEWR